MGNTAELAMVQKMIIDTLHKEAKSQRIITESDERWFSYPISSFQSNLHLICFDTVTVKGLL